MQVGTLPLMFVKSYDVCDVLYLPQRWMLGILTDRIRLNGHRQRSESSLEKRFVAAALKRSSHEMNAFYIRARIILTALN